MPTLRKAIYTPCLSAVLTLLPFALGATSIAVMKQADEPLSLEQARAYMIELINRDRASLRLTPLKMDPTATLAGQKHAEEMATQTYLSHWNRQGKLPDQRYNEQGGTDYVRENIYLQTRSGDTTDSSVLPLIANPTYTRREIEEIETAYFNEVPPNDGHRRNILSEQHTHVGIALAKARNGQRSAIANTQEFVDRYLEVDNIPSTCLPGSEVLVSGKITGPVKFRSITIGRASLPVSMSKEALTQTRGYSRPPAFETYWPYPYKSPRPVQLSAEQRFSIRVPLSERRQPGLYYVSIWVEENGKEFISSQRTVAVQ